MATWIELNNTKGEYQSQAIDISSFFDYYISNINVNYTDNDGDVAVYVRTSHDGGANWGQWADIKDDLVKDVFDGHGVKMSDSKLQFKVVLDLGSNTYGLSPVFNQFSISLLGAYKIENTGDLECLPEIWVKKIGYGDVYLTNETTGKTLVLKDINNNETIYIDNENKDIITDLPLTYRFSNHNKEWFKLQDGDNIITGTGDFELDVRHEFRVLQG